MLRIARTSPCRVRRGGVRRGHRLRMVRTSPAAIKDPRLWYTVDECTHHLQVEEGGRAVRLEHQPQHQRT